MNSKYEESYSSEIISVIKNEVSIVSFMLFFVTFLFNVNFQNRGVFAKPLLLFLISALFILYGIVIRISSILIKNHSLKCSIVFNKISTIFYILSILLFVFSCDLMLVGVQGLKDLPEIYHTLQIIAMVIVIIPLSLLALSLLSNLKKR